MEDGTTKSYHGGFFSVCLNETQQKWLPCEAECLGVKLVLEHFAQIIKESNQQVTHFCDNLPTVLAFQKLKQGKFSSSPRIAAFLTSVNKFDVNIDVEAYAADQMSRIRCAFGFFLPLDLLSYLLS